MHHLTLTPDLFSDPDQLRSPSLCDVVLLSWQVGAHFSSLPRRQACIENRQMSLATRRVLQSIAGRERGMSRRIPIAVLYDSRRVGLQS
jgi:hypothetical protein